MIKKVASNNYVACCFKPSLFMYEGYGLTADLWQQELLDEAPNKVLLLCSRQSGKSTVCATMALHRAVYYPGSLVLIISYSLRQAGETFRKVKQGLPFISPFCSVVHETQTMVELMNGSRIVSLPGKQESIRSFSSVALLILDEAAQINDELYNSVRPMLAVSKGRLVALSTPYGKRGWFHKAWVSDTSWYRVKITANDCPRITSEFLDEERNELGDWWYRQEYYCEFLDTDSQIFGYDLIMDAIGDEIPLISM